MPQFKCKFLSLLLLLVCCTNNQSVENQIFVTATMASVRSEPSEKSQEIAQIGQGKYLGDLGEVSMAESVLNMGGQRVQSPWMKIQTPDGQRGWVLAWSLMPSQNGAEWLLQKRMEAYFGSAVCTARNALFEEIINLQTDAQLSKAWRSSRGLRDTMLTLLTRRPQQSEDLRFDWLNEAIPGHFYQKNSDNGNGRLLADFRYWHQKALQTSGKQDDDFFQICLEVYPLDGTESFAPVWKFELPDAEPLSHLGAGHHLRILQRLDRALAQGSVFTPNLLEFKELLLEDIFGQQQRYWLSAAKIKGELADILANPPSCLSQRERDALAIRQKMFDAPAEHGISVDLRSGGY